jgi:hypothetical protein
VPDKVQIEEDLLFAFASTIAAALGIGLSMAVASYLGLLFRRSGSGRRSQVLNGDHTSHRNLRAKLMRAHSVLRTMRCFAQIALQMCVRLAS